MRRAAAAQHEADTARGESVSTQEGDSDVYDDGPTQTQSNSGVRCWTWSHAKQRYHWRSSKKVPDVWF